MTGVAAAPFERSEPVAGVRLVTERMPYLRSVSLGLWVDVGSRDEPDEMAGASHLLEHLLFKGTGTRSAREIAETVDAVGGELNAYSSKEHTCYYARVLDEDVGTAADILLDMFSDAILRDEDLEAERKVVLEELHMTEDAPDDKVHDVFGETAWPGHPLGRPVLGTESSVGAMTREGLAGFYRSGYLPGRLIVAAAGNVDHGDLEGRLAQAFEASPRSAPRTPQRPPELTRRTSYETRTTEQQHLVWGCEALSRTDPDRYALTVLSTLLGGGMSSRLFQEVRELRGLAYSIYSYHHLYTETGLFAVYAGCHESSAAEVLSIVRDQAAAVAAGAAGAEEVERAKGHVRGSIVLSLDDPGGRMSRLGKAELVHGEISSVDEQLAKVDAVTTGDVERVARRLFGGDFVLTSIGPLAQGTLDAFVDAL